MFIFIPDDDFPLTCIRNFFLNYFQPWKQAAAPQSYLAINSKWSEYWDLILNPSIRQHLSFGDTSNPVTNTLSLRTSRNAQPSPTVSAAQDLGLFPDTGLSDDETVSNATKKSVECFFTHSNPSRP